METAWIFAVDTVRVTYCHMDYITSFLCVITSGLLYNAVKIFQIYFSRVMPSRHHGIFCCWTKEMSVLNLYSVEHTCPAVSSR